MSDIDKTPPEDVQPENDGEPHNMASRDMAADEAALADDRQVEETPKRKGIGFLGRLAIILAALGAALGAGALGGFAAQRFYDLPAPPPDLSQYERDIKALKKSDKAQSARSTQLEGQIKTAAARLGQELSELDAKWQSDLADLNSQIDVIEISAPLPVEGDPAPLSERSKESDISEPNVPEISKSNPDTVNPEAFGESEEPDSTSPDVSEPNVPEINDPEINNSGAADTDIETADKDVQSRDIGSPADPRSEIRPEILAEVDALRRRVDNDIAAIKIRLDDLEADPKVRLPAQGNAKDGTDPASPINDILTELKAAEDPQRTQNWFGKILQKHVSLKRTDYDAAAALLAQIEAAILIEDWEAALELSQSLPQPARGAAQEWIASARR